MTQQKVCTKCNESKNLSEFYRRKDTKDNLSYECKDCRSKARRNYDKSKIGFIIKMYSNQKMSCKRRGMENPTYSFLELKNYIFNHPNFEKLYTNWKSSNFSKMLYPSIDRLDDYKTYSLDNIRLCTWQENKDKGHLDQKNGKNRKNCKAVIQYSIDGEKIKEYYSIGQAMRETGTKDSSIIRCCEKERKTANKFMWKYKNKGE